MLETECHLDEVRYNSRYSVQGSSVERRALKNYIRQIHKSLRLSKVLGNTHLCNVVWICQANFSQLLCCKQSIVIAAMGSRRVLDDFASKKKPRYILGFNVHQ